MTATNDKLTATIAEQHDTLPADESRCCLCDEAPAEHVMERWAGEWQAACEHGACADCLSDWIAEQLPRCRADGLLRIDCPCPGCRKTMPQKLVLAMSRAASAQAEEIDDVKRPKISDVCPICIRPSAFVDSRLWGDAHSHECQDVCGTCLTTWIGASLEDCRRDRKRVTVPCLGAGCAKELPSRLVFSLSPEAVALDRVLQRVTRLKSNPLYPSACQVDCPREDCLGIGYLGSEKVMCFLCEEQWDAPTGITCLPYASGAAAEAGAGDIVLPPTVKRCPKCAVPISKDGGCDHMTCSRCRHEWWWSTLKPFRAEAVPAAA